jgi:hypothetical protein
VGRQYSLSSASGSVDHPASRVVLRRSLQSLMPGPREVLKRFWEPLVLQVWFVGGRGVGGGGGGEGGVVLWQSHQSLMPGPREVLEHFWVLPVSAN